MLTFEREVRIRPAYDCLAVQPCVHGSATCGVEPGRSHGRHGAEMHMVLRGPVAEVILVVGTGWDHPDTPPSASIRNHWDELPHGSFVEFHSAVPHYEGHEPQEADCEQWSSCFSDRGYSMAAAPARLLVVNGSDAAWGWLEAKYHESFPTNAVAALLSAPTEEN